MRILLDTHALLWFIEGDAKLSVRAKDLIQDTQNEVFVSMASFFEMAIKLRLQKLKLTKSLSEIYHDVLISEIGILPINQFHVFNYENIPLIDTHRDPFDRMLIATAQYEKLVLISIDDKFAHYTDVITVIW
ncbi:MAG: type II toxin-antitoxin system VapC family toxin [Spirosomaceae bacterium]|jgi:PIN domain nuclease of toxin-antitoxin system|nr:type II toxin-antitoxin system VapC family toxin [Spirosomataceae bacterium]